ncbi:2-deoxy-D-gluconate 3-dehydrogenase [Limnohabitans sp. Jir61]|jgi:glucose 1-dehydrogenase|uniref:SDR family NAD(P)-dependent oxidoreductase n=1 Tax=Limnohabitans sp. Jir61 TaxID=1826168 RepID=UPI000D374565|nr:SDR family NAD(P)-dependent oxidoreductase [Limnohabitans sp. Jir61]PUE32638.1 2-deoxy-D-gluconate 3-dehydrogenase [Limnohabitans sp. Jir61]
MRTTQDWLKLSGKVCVVTGAASGIGASISELLCQEGAHVAMLDRDEVAVKKMADALRQLGGDVLPLVCDISQPDDVTSAAQKVLSHWQRCDVLVNNAGLLRAGSLSDVSLQDWQHVLNVNLTGYLLCSRAFVEPMKSEGRGSVVNIASISGLFPQSGSGSYSASKAGVLQMSRQMAVEWGPLGIRSNAICPGMIRTALSAKFYEVPGFEAKRAAVTASRRVGESSDIANVALFLASERSAYVNGAELVVDGGMQCMLMDMVPRPGYNQSN